MSTKHTPGPWKAYTAAKNQKEYQVYTDTSGHIACGVEHVAWTNTEANARLISAAPEMLVALEAALNWLECTGVDNGINLKIHAAIAKARGES